MAHTYEQILAKLGGEAQPVPGAVMVHRDGRNVVIAELANGALLVTREGADILDSLDNKPTKRSRKADTEVGVDDLDLDAGA